MRIARTIDNYEYFCYVNFYNQSTIVHITSAVKQCTFSNSILGSGAVPVVVWE